MYEGYGPNGVALLIECLSDNRNRAASEVRVAVTRNGGNMADPGSVSYMFNRKGVVLVPKKKMNFISIWLTPMVNTLPISITGKNKQRTIKCWNKYRE